MRDIHLGNNIPLKHFIFRIGCDWLTCLTVHLGEVDLQRPLIVTHDIVIRAVHRHRDRLTAAMLSVVELKTDGHNRFFKTEVDYGKFISCGGNCSIYHILCFIPQLTFRFVLCLFCRSIRLGLTGIGAFLTTQAGGGGFAHFIVQTPTGTAIAAV